MRLGRIGQSTVEYVLFLSVIAMAMVLVAQTIVPEFGEGLVGMQDNVNTVVSDGVVQGGGG